MPADVQRAFYDATEALGKEGYARRLAMLRGFDVRDRLRDLRVPTLLLAGDRDHLLPSLRAARELAALLPHASLRALKGQGHSCLVGDRVDLRAVLDGWFASMSGMSAVGSNSDDMHGRLEP